MSLIRCCSLRQAVAAEKRLTATSWALEHGSICAPVLALLMPSIGRSGAIRALASMRSDGLLEMQSLQRHRGGRALHIYYPTPRLAAAMRHHDALDRTSVHTTLTARALLAQLTRAAAMSAGAHFDITGDVALIRSAGGIRTRLQLVHDVPSPVALERWTADAVTQIDAGIAESHGWIVAQERDGELLRRVSVAANCSHQPVLTPAQLADYLGDTQP